MKDVEKAQDQLVDAIESLAGKINKDTSANDALKFTQAALNAANSIITLSNIE